MSELCRQQPPCPNVAAYRYSWPGQADSLVCVEHASKLRAVAAALGFEVQLVPLEPAAPAPARAERPRFWILEGRTPKAVATALEWSAWFETAHRVVAHTETVNGVKISTVFIGIDHDFLLTHDAPLLFESMVFESHAEGCGGSELDGECVRYSTWAEALAGHDALVARVRAARPA